MFIQKPWLIATAFLRKNVIPENQNSQALSKKNKMERWDTFSKMASVNNAFIISNIYNANVFWDCMRSSDPEISWCKQSIRSESQKNLIVTNHLLSIQGYLAFFYFIYFVFYIYEARLFLVNKSEWKTNTARLNWEEFIILISHCLSQLCLSLGAVALFLFQGVHQLVWFLLT